MNGAGHKGDRYSTIKKNLLAGFIVSLVALPLSLGLATASGVPPMSGIIAAFVGGVFVSLRGGSFVTIAGPGNGLVVAILTAVVVMGNGNLSSGYPHALAAIVVAGLVMVLLAYFGMGRFSDFFPSASINGILSAIGLIIIAKQIHILFGAFHIPSSNNIVSFIDLPNTVIEEFTRGEVPWPAIVGLVSLAIMALHSRWRYRFISSVPAPMWILLFSIAFFGIYHFLEVPFPIAQEQLLHLPQNISEAIHFPNFEKTNEWIFWRSVIAIVFIAGLESMLSINAVDKLDPRKRRSDVNQDLKALGFATSLSGCFGGLPVVAVIARSSVNIHQGASGRLSNLFHGIFVAIFVVLFGNLLNVIPLSALAAILVYTGYKLASPSILKKNYKAGKDQFAIFISTLITTLIFGLIAGIVVGIIVALIVQLIQTEDRIGFLKLMFRPNTLLYEESDGALHLSIKSYASFLNFLAIKKHLESIPAGKNLILDFSLTNFVDHSVQEHIYHFGQNYKKTGGSIEVVGLDIHEPTSSHPFAARRILRLTSVINKKPILTKRQQKLKDFAKTIHWEFKTDAIGDFPLLEKTVFFKYKRITKAYNVFKGEEMGVRIYLMDIEFTEGGFIAQETYKQTILYLSLREHIPKFRLDKERIFDRIASFAGFEDINLDHHEEFSNKYWLKGEDKDAIQQFFSDELVLFFESHPIYHLESNGNGIIIFKRQRLATIDELKALAVYGRGLINYLLPKKID